jgi:hypothetical protein
VDARTNLGVTLFQKGQVDAAVARYKKALAINRIQKKQNHLIIGVEIQKKR